MENTHLMFATQFGQRRRYPILRRGDWHIIIAIDIFSAIVCLIPAFPTAYEQLAPLYLVSKILAIVLFAFSTIAMMILYFLFEPGEYIQMRGIRVFFGNTKYQAYLNVTNYGLSIIMSEQGNYAEKNHFTLNYTWDQIKKIKVRKRVLRIQGLPRIDCGKNRVFTQLDDMVCNSIFDGCRLYLSIPNQEIAEKVNSALESINY